MQAVYAQITALTDAFCREKLNEEYAQLCREMTAALARKRPSPLLGGNPKSWACGIAYTIGSVNFLFNKSQVPHLRTDELCNWFGLSKNTGGSKASQIKQALKIKWWDPKWTLPSQIENHPMVWMVTVNGLIVDARHLPRPLQEEAYRKGLIPYLPAEQDDD
jgi:hypothetical protein